MADEIEEVTINGHLYTKNGAPGGRDLRKGGWFRWCLDFAADIMASLSGLAASVAAALGHANAAAASAAATQSYAAALRGTSASSVTLALGPLAFDVGSAVKQWAPGVWLIASRTSDPTKWAIGPATYAGNVVTINAARISGAEGPFTDWTIQLTGMGGPQGLQGIPGVQDLVYVAKAINFNVGAADKATLFDCTNSITATFATAATLADKWWAYVRNSGTGDVTISGSDGVSNWLLYPGAVRLFWCNGLVLRSAPLVGGRKVFTAPGDHVAAPGVAELSLKGNGSGGGGASGGCTASSVDTTGGNGGAGGEYLELLIPAPAPGTTTSVTIPSGAVGGAAVPIASSAVNGNAGGNGGDTLFGNLFRAKGGKGGPASSSEAAVGGGLPANTGGVVWAPANQVPSGSTVATVATDLGGASGGKTTATPSGTGNAGKRSLRAGGGGGVGGGISAANTPYAGGPGGATGRLVTSGALESPNDAGSGPAGGANTGANGTSASTARVDSMGQDGGGGGGANPSGKGGDGGDGGVGGGGGGGGAGRGVSSGKGGNGGRGELVVKEIV